ncbi:MAG: aspartyl/glutamyl-tRNA(Asn/Gln) amidotransferase subunit, partial [Chloroflexi bacterium]|nr:aspartyl/glutamyl-tRNA(Asn/Gln) amidotransferase subunit [Chloroflexota bacterium]
IRVLESGGTIVQETRGWKEDTRQTVSQRSKEQAEDYRYFPEPDLPPLVLDPAWIEEIRADLPEMAGERAARLERDFGLPEADVLQLTRSRSMADLFELTAGLLSGDKREVAKWLLGEFQRLLNEAGMEADEQSTVRPEGLAALIRMIESRDVSSTAAKTAFEEYFRTGEDPTSIVRRLGLLQVSDRASLEPIARKAIAENENAVADYKRGKTQALGRVVGAVMKEMRGANPALVGELLRELIDQQEV